MFGNKSAYELEAPTAEFVTTEMSESKENMRCSRMMNWKEYERKTYRGLVQCSFPIFP
jgi:hypothetical protein